MKKVRLYTGKGGFPSITFGGIDRTYLTLFEASFLKQLFASVHQSTFSPFKYILLQTGRLFTRERENPASEMLQALVCCSNAPFGISDDRKSTNRFNPGTQGSQLPYNKRLLW